VNADEPCYVLDICISLFHVIATYYQSVFRGFFLGWNKYFGALIGSEKNCKNNFFGCIAVKFSDFHKLPEEGGYN